MKQYIYGIHQWYDVDNMEYRVMQMVDTMLSLSNASGGRMFHVRTSNVKDAIAFGKNLAVEHNCNFLEVNCAHGNGSYKLIGIGR